MTQAHRRVRTNVNYTFCQRVLGSTPEHFDLAGMESRLGLATRRCAVLPAAEPWPEQPLAAKPPALQPEV